MESSERRTNWVKIVEVVAILLGIVVAGITIFRFTTGSTTLPEYLRTIFTGTSSAFVDQFNDSLYDGNYDLSRWKVFNYNSEDGRAFQNNGKLTVLNSYLIPLQYSQFVLSAPLSIESKIMIDQSASGHAFIFIGVVDFGEYADCVYGRQANNKAQLGCNYMVPDGKRLGYSTPKIFVDYGTWHTLRIEIRPETMEYRYYVDGQEIGSYTPPNGDELKRENYLIQIGAGRDESSTETYSGYFEYVKIDEIKP